jgi:hypothetical protein
MRVALIVYRRTTVTFLSSAILHRRSPHGRVTEPLTVGSRELPPGVYALDTLSPPAVEAAAAAELSLSLQAENPWPDPTVIKRVTATFGEAEVTQLWTALPEVAASLARLDLAAVPAHHGDAATAGVEPSSGVPAGPLLAEGSAAHRLPTLSAATLPSFASEELTGEATRPSLRKLPSDARRSR